MNAHLKSIVDRLKRGEAVSSTDKAIYELDQRQAKRVSNILKTFNSSSKKYQERLSNLLGGDDRLRTAMRQAIENPSASDRRVLNYVKNEKHRRMIVIDKFEELPD